MADLAHTDASARFLARLRLPPNLPAPSLAQIQRLQSAIAPIRTEQPQPQHFFHPGWYERRLMLPAGSLVVGKIHRHKHPVGVIYGHAFILSEFGSDEVRTGYFAVSEPGVKRVVLTIKDTLFVTLHRNPSNTRDLAQIEAEHIDPEAFTLDGASAQVLQ